MYATVDSDGFITGIGSAYHSAAVEVPPEFTQDSQRSWRYINNQWQQDFSKLHQAAIERIRQSVTDQLAATEWRIQRAQERDKIGAAGEAEHEVLAEREALRRAGNRAETEIRALTSQLEIEAYAVTVQSEDYPAVNSLTRLQFMRRFTTQEQAAILTARDSGQSPELTVFWEQLQLSSHIRLDDPDVHAGVQLLETAGLIVSGRADDIMGATL